MSAAARDAALPRRRRVAGQAAVEYVGMLLVAATVVALIASSDVAARVANAIDSAICQVSNGPDANCDSSEDKLADGDEKRHAREPDADSDGLSDREERRLGTLPGKADSDADGLLDGDELRRDTNPTEPDSDGDGISDGDEVKLSGQRSRESGQDFDPTKRDGDGDGLDDGQELALRTPPGHADADLIGGGAGLLVKKLDDVLAQITSLFRRAPKNAAENARRNLQQAAQRRLDAARQAPAAAPRSPTAKGTTAGSIYPRVASPGERSRIGQELVEDYLTHPQGRERVRRDGVRIFELPDGRGVSFNPDGSFRGLLEPRP